MVECMPNGTDAAIHHIRRGNHIGPGLSLHDGLLAQECNGLIVDNFWKTIRPLSDDPVVAMRRIGIECHIGDETAFGKLLAKPVQNSANKVF